MKKIYWLTDPTTPKQLSDGMKNLRIQNIPTIRWDEEDFWWGSKFTAHLFRHSTAITTSHDVLLIRESDIVFVRLVFGGREFTPEINMDFDDDYLNEFWDKRK